MRTLRASYTLRRMFFSSYCCCIFKISMKSCSPNEINYSKNKGWSSICTGIEYLVWGCQFTIGICKLSYKFICNLTKFLRNLDTKAQMQWTRVATISTTGVFKARNNIWLNRRNMTEITCEKWRKLIILDYY